MFDRLFTIAFFVLLPFQLLGNNESYLLDFTQIQGNALDWFEERGWEEQVDMDKMNPRFENGSLVIEAKDAVSGVFFKDFRPESKRLSGINTIRTNGEWNNILKEQTGPVRLKKRGMSGTQLV